VNLQRFSNWWTTSP